MKEKEGELHLRYRPKIFSEFIGSETIKESILSSLHRTHTFIFHGLRGCGKTTLARLLAYELEIKDRDIIEIDAADKTGIDDARQLKSTVSYAAMGGKNKIYIIDECHRLTGNAMDSLLKTFEEPPEHVYFVLCTTEINKLSKTIRSRAKEYELRPLSKINGEKLIDWICKEEGFEVPSSIRKLIIERCEGVPREIVISVDKVRDMEDVEKAKELIQSVSEKAEVIELCRLLVKGSPWKEVSEVLKGIPDEPEQVRRAVLGYLKKVLLNNGGDRIADMIFLFGENVYDGGAAVLSACCFRALKL